jgi:hypothetical protein
MGCSYSNDSISTKTIGDKGVLYNDLNRPRPILINGNKSNKFKRKNGDDTNSGKKKCVSFSEEIVHVDESPEENPTLLNESEETTTVRNDSKDTKDTGGSHEHEANCAEKVFETYNNSTNLNEREGHEHHENEKKKNMEKKSQIDEMESHDMISLQTVIVNLE